MSNAKEEIADKTLSRKSFTPYSNRRKSGSNGCFAPFKAPTPNKGTPIKSKKIDLARKLVDLKEKSDSLDQELETLYTEDELDAHIERLHDYNDIKDFAQMLLGRLAELEQTTTKSLYERYNLELDD